MGLYRIKSEMLTKVPKVEFKEFGYLEKDLQSLIVNDPSVLGEELLIIGEEYKGWQESKKRLDLLALDRFGNLVVIEIKRDNDGFHMDLQAIRYAAMLSLMTYENAIDTYTKYLESKEEDSLTAQKRINDFLEYNNDDDNFEFAKDIRIILVNNHYSRELTSSVLWLRGKGIDVKCIEVTPYQDKDDNSIYLDIDTLIPLREANDYMIAIEKKEQEKELVLQEMKKGRDYTKYLFEGNQYTKNRLVLNVIKEYVKLHPDTDFKKLKELFPDDLQGSTGVVKTLDEYRGENRKGKRFFDEKDEIIELSNEEQVVVCTQWGIGNINQFIERARQLNFKIEEIAS